MAVTLSGKKLLSPFGSRAFFVLFLEGGKGGNIHTFSFNIFLERAVFFYRTYIQLDKVKDHSVTEHTFVGAI
jgi:hypothetical protein